MRVGGERGEAGGEERAGEVRVGWVGRGEGGPGSEMHQSRWASGELSE